MKYIKKIFIFLTILTVSFSLFSCSENSTTDDEILNAIDIACKRLGIQFHGYGVTE